MYKMTKHERGISVIEGEITLNPPTEGCNLVTVKVGDAYSLHIFTHAGDRGHVHPLANAGNANIDVMGGMKLTKKPVRRKVDGFDYFEISNLTPLREV